MQTHEHFFFENQHKILHTWFDLFRLIWFVRRCRAKRHMAFPSERGFRESVRVCVSLLFVWSSNSYDWLIDCPTYAFVLISSHFVYALVRPILHFVCLLSDAFLSGFELLASMVTDEFRIQHSSSYPRWPKSFIIWRPDRTIKVDGLLKVIMPFLCSTSFCSMLAMQNAIICVDRWLAVLYPIWYRTKKKRYSVYATLTALLYHNLFYLPLWIKDMTVEISPHDYCDFTRAFPIYQQVVRVLTIFLPQAFLFVSYPILLIKVDRLKRRRVAGNQEPIPAAGSAHTRPNRDAFPVILSSFIWTYGSWLRKRRSVNMKVLSCCRNVTVWLSNNYPTLIYVL